MSYFDEDLREISGERWQPLAEKPKGKLEAEVEKSKSASVAPRRTGVNDWVSALADVSAFLGYFPFKLISGGALLYDLDSRILPYYVCGVSIGLAIKMARR